MEQQSEYQVQRIDNIQVVNVEEFAMTPDRVVKQVRLIQEVMEKIMKKDDHYGIIPGTEKPTLLKPGAEKLSVTFRLVPKYDIKQIDMANGHREIQIVCSLIHAPSGQFFGQGVGSCTTMETRYRYRNADPEVTDKPIPKAYWNLKNANKMNEAQNLIGGKGFRPKKTESGWFIAKLTGEKTEHDNPADYYNTILKMAKKRAHVDAVLTATAASDIFTQDLEDMGELIAQNGKPEPAKSTENDEQEHPKTKTRAKTKEPEKPVSENTNGKSNIAGDAQKSFLSKAASKKIISQTRDTILDTIPADITIEALNHLLGYLNETNEPIELDTWKNAIKEVCS